MYRIIHSDFLKYLRDYRDVARRGFMPKYHAVLCDPPYFLGSIVKRFGAENAAPAKDRDGTFQRQSRGFMGQTWDGFESPRHYQAWVEEWASMLLDFVYPGAVLMAFGGTRTYHRLVSGLEDAGWEIQDCIMAWTYGSGFPKSHDYEKAFRRLRHGGNLGAIGNHAMLHLSLQERLIYFKQEKLYCGYGSALKPSYEPIVVARAPRGNYSYADCALKFGSGALHIDGGRIDTFYNNDGRNLRDTPFSDNTQVPNKQIGTKTRSDPHNSGRFPANTILVHHPDCGEGDCVEACHVRVMGEQSGERKAGSPVSGNEPSPPHSEYIYHGRDRVPYDAYNDEGTAARFFYQAKAASWERDSGLDLPHPPTPSPNGEGESFPLVESGGMQGTKDKSLKTGAGNERNNLRRNPHPTVKPIQLIEYLAGILKPPIEGSRILIPFSGSGSEMIGARLAGWEHITGIEMTDQYIPVARARLAWWSQFSSYEEAKAAHDDSQKAIKIAEEKKESGQLSLFDVIPEAPNMAVVERNDDGFMLALRR